MPPAIESRNLGKGDYNMFNFGRLKVRTYSPPTILTEMILIDKLSFTKYYSVIIWLIIIVPCSIIFQGCEKEDYYSTDNG